MRFMSLPVAAAALLLTTGAAFAGDQDFTLVNKTGYQIDKVYVGPTSSDSWGKDILGRDTLDDGENVKITFPHSASTCKWDLKVVYEDGDNAVWKNINLCDIDKITIYWNQKTQTSTAKYE